VCETIHSLYLVQVPLAEAVKVLASRRACQKHWSDNHYGLLRLDQIKAMCLIPWAASRGRPCLGRGALSR
jgi:hypothetical protein